MALIVVAGVLLVVMGGLVALGETVARRSGDELRHRCGGHGDEHRGPACLRPPGAPAQVAR